jgi:hypothetical protein
MAAFSREERFAYGIGLISLFVYIVVPSVLLHLIWPYVDLDVFFAWMLLPALVLAYLTGVVAETVVRWPRIHRVLFEDIRDWKLPRIDGK